MYDQIARYYDLTHDALTADTAYLLAQAKNLDGPILELGCGSGRLLQPLAQAGHSIVGVDNSRPMLARAAARLRALPLPINERAVLHEANMTQLAFTEWADGCFALALLPYNTALHLTPDQIQQTLRGVRRYLAEDGRLFIDVTNPFLIAATPNDRLLTLENTLTDPETGDIVLQQAANWLDEERQVLHITWVYDASPAAGGPVQRTVAQADYHYLFPHQLEMALNEAGFQLQHFAGDYDGGSFGEESERLLVWATPVMGGQAISQL